MASKSKQITVKNTEVSMLLDEMMERGGGRGVSTDQADNITPLIYILQSQSPQVLKRNPAYIQGAEAGCIWLRNVANPIVSGEEGIIFQPCFFTKDWVEWIPRDAGGGFVGKHLQLPRDATRDDRVTNKPRFVMPNGNELRETRYHMGYVYGHADAPLPFVIPMSSSGHTISKSWMGLQNAKRTKGGKRADAFAYLYSLKTRLRTNAQGEWFTWDIGDYSQVSSIEDYRRGEELYEYFKEGKLVAETPLHDEGEEIQSEI